jgi:hypothetical protein
MAQAIQAFVAACQLPALLERGETPIPINSGRFRVDLSPRGLWLEAWDEHRMWSRRILSAAQSQRHRLELEAFRFGKKPVKVTLVDAADSRSTAALEKSQRSAFTERFRLFLNRHFGAWRLEEFRAEANLERSQSPLYPAALYTRGSEAVAAVGAPSRDTQFHALTFALIFLAGVRQRHGDICGSRLLLYLPESHARPVISLARRLRPGLQVDIWLYGDDGHETLLDPDDKGNLESSLAPRASQLAGPAWWLELLGSTPYVDSIEESNGSFSYRIRGYEVAKLLSAFENALPKIRWGPQLRSEALPNQRSRIERYFETIESRRRANPPDLLDPVYLAAPERWLESSLRDNLTEINPTLAAPVYGQVLGSYSGEYSAADLLARDTSGRLAILELKTTEDIHLPLQAFDYWLRIREHLQSGEFRSSGYWPGQELRTVPPKLYLVAPALHFHPSTQAVLSFLPPECEVEIVGLAANWRQRATVALRM